MQILTPKQEQQKLFDDANKKLESSFYRHSNDPVVNAESLEKFKDSLSSTPPPLPERHTNLYTVQEVAKPVFKRKRWFSLKKEAVTEYTYIVIRDGEFISGDWDDIKVAYQQANYLNKQMLDAQTPEPKLDENDRCLTNS